MKDIKFVCPQCGEDIFKPGNKINIKDDLNNPASSCCSRRFTEKDVIEQAKLATRELSVNAYRNR